MNPSRSKSFRPAMEALENRDNMSCTAVLTSGVLAITGDAADNHVVITQSDSRDRLSVNCDRVVTNFASSAVHSIKADLKAGDDEFHWYLQGNLDFSKSAQILLGDGDDQAFLGISNGGVLYKDLNIKLKAGTGEDELQAWFGAKQGGALNLWAWMGDGNDTASATMNGDLSDPARVNFTLLGEAGDDALSTTTNWDDYVAIGHGSALSYNVNGGAGEDSIYADYSGALAGRLNLTLDGSYDRDEITGRINVRNGSTGSIVAREFGRDGNDRVSLDIDRNLSPFALVKALIDGGDGIDFGSNSSNVTRINCELPLQLPPGIGP